MRKPTIADVKRVVGINPRKSFFTPLDLIPWVGPAGKTVKGVKMVRQGLKAGKPIAGGIATTAVGAAFMYGDFIQVKWVYGKLFPGSNTNIVTPGRGVITSQLSRKPARSGKIGRRRKRCTHRDSRGRRCLRPAGHSGRHRYS